MFGSYSQASSPAEGAPARSVKVTVATTLCVVVLMTVSMLLSVVSMPAAAAVSRSTLACDEAGV